MSPSPHTDAEKRRTHTPTHPHTRTRVCACAHTHTHTHTHTLLRAWLWGTAAVCWELRLRPTGGTDFMEASLPHPLSPSAGLRRRYQVAGSAPARLGAGGGLWSWVPVCMRVCFISHSSRVSTHNAAVSCRYVGVIYSVDASHSCTHTQNLTSSSSPRTFNILYCVKKRK